jgi:hypothetical protein
MKAAPVSAVAGWGGSMVSNGAFISYFSGDVPLAPDWGASGSAAGFGF